MMKRNPIDFIRQEFALWKLPLDEFNDEHIEKMLVEYGMIIASFEYTPKQAAKRLRDR